MTTFKKLSLAALSALVALAFSMPAAAGEKKFVDSDDAKEKDEAQDFLKDYDKLVKGKEADWVYFTEGVDLKSFKHVSIGEFSASKKGSKTRGAAEDGAGYLDKWISDSKKLGWSVAKGGGDLTIVGNIAGAWEPSSGARMWGGWMANPGVVVELMGRDKGGQVVFQIRHKSKGSSLGDAVENALENVVKTLEKGK